MSACLWVIGNSPPTAVKLNNSVRMVHADSGPPLCGARTKVTINDGLHQKWLQASIGEQFEMHCKD